MLLDHPQEFCDSNVEHAACYGMFYHSDYNRGCAKGQIGDVNDFYQPVCVNLSVNRGWPKVLTIKLVIINPFTRTNFVVTGWLMVNNTAW